jgi:hypothetical protein
MAATSLSAIPATRDSVCPGRLIAEDRSMAGIELVGDDYMCWAEHRSVVKSEWLPVIQRRKLQSLEPLEYGDVDFNGANVKAVIDDFETLKEEIRCGESPRKEAFVENLDNLIRRLRQDFDATGKTGWIG